MNVDLPRYSPQLHTESIETVTKIEKLEEVIKPIFDTWEDLLAVGIGFDNQKHFMDAIIKAVVNMEKNQK